VYKQEPKQTRIHTRAQEQVSDKAPSASTVPGAAALAIDTGPRLAARRKLADQINGSHRQRAAAARLHGLPGRAGAVQLVKDPKNALATTVMESWTIDITDAKRFVAWCKTADEVDEWLAGQTYEEWRMLQQYLPQEHDPDKIAALLQKVMDGPKVVGPRKAAAAAPSAEELQISAGIAAEERRAAQKAALATDRTATLTAANLIPTPAKFTQNSLVETVWEAARNQYIRSGPNSMAIAGTYDEAVVDAAMAVWRNIQPGGLITHLSRFAGVQDKSSRPDGGANTANLESRERQGNFIITLDGHMINVHVNVK
jgi:hypothetical protein